MQSEDLCLAVLVLFLRKHACFSQPKVLPHLIPEVFEFRRAAIGDSELNVGR
jgi:hypothetical protein